MQSGKNSRSAYNLSMIQIDPTPTLVPLDGFTVRSMSNESSLEKGLIPLSGPQKNKLQGLVNDPPYAPNFAQTGEINPNMKVFIANFDGTWNDKDKVPKGESKTIVGLLYEESKRQESPDVESHYLHGVGTRTRTKARVLYEGVTGSGCEDRAERMHNQLVETAARWKAENPSVEIHVHAVGFSRGAATALHFLNLVDERGAMPFNKVVNDGLAPGQVKSSAVLLDVVATGQENTLNLTVPPTAQSVLHLTAGGEERRHFKVTTLGDRRYDSKGNPTNLLDNPEWAEAKGVSAPPYVHEGPLSVFNPEGNFIYQRIQQISLNGTRHSDVGGGYIENGIAGVPMFLVSGFQKSLGLPGAEPVLPSTKEIQKAMAHDSRDKIELTRQNLESLFGKKFDHGKVERRIAKEQERPWNGDILRSVRICILTDDGYQVKDKQFRMVVPHKEGDEKQTLKELAANQILTYDPSIRLKSPGAHPFQSTQKGAFVLEGGTKQNLLFKGVRIDDSTHDDSLFTEFMKDAQKKKLQMVVMVDDERLFCPLQKCSQDIWAGATLVMPKQKDPWPQGIRNAIAVLNDRTHFEPSRKNPIKRLTNMEAKNLLASAMEDASIELGKEFPQVAKVRFKVDKDGSSTEKNTVTVAAYGEGSSSLMSNKKRAEGSTEGSMRHRLMEMAEGIDCVVKMLKKSGYNMDGYEVKMTTENEIKSEIKNEFIELENDAQEPKERNTAKSAFRPGMR